MCDARTKSCLTGELAAQLQQPVPGQRMHSDSTGCNKKKKNGRPPRFPGTFLQMCRLKCVSQTVGSCFRLPFDTCSHGFTPDAAELGAATPTRCTSSAAGHHSDEVMQSLKHSRNVAWCSSSQQQTSAVALAPRRSSRRSIETLTCWSFWEMLALSPPGAASLPTKCLDLITS